MSFLFPEKQKYKIKKKKALQQAHNKEEEIKR